MWVNQMKVLLHLPFIHLIVKNSSGGFFDEIPWNWILIGVAGVELMVIVIIAVVKKRK